MAKLPVFTKKTAPDTSQEYIAKLDDLLKRNRGGGVVQGYDAESSYSPMVVGGSVADPTGLGQTAQQIKYDVSPDLAPEDQATLDMLSSVLEMGDLTPEQRNYFNMLQDNFAGPYTTNNSMRNVPEYLRPPEYQNRNLPPQEPQNIEPVAPQNAPQPMRSSNTTFRPGQMQSAQQRPQMVSTPKPYPVASLGNGMSRYSDGSVGRSPEITKTPEQITQPDEFTQDIQRTAELASEADRYSNPAPQAPQPTLSPKQVNENLGIPMNAAKDMKGYTQSDVEALNKFKSEPDYMQQVGQGFKNRVDEQIAGQRGLTTDQLREENAWEPEPVNLKAMQPVRQNPIRQAIGNTVETIGDAIPGLGEMGISEFIAGGPTRHSGQVQAADYEISEPDPEAQYQPGAGIDSLKGQFQSAQSNNQGIIAKPTMQSIQGMNRSVGEFVGQSASDLASARQPTTNQTFQSQQVASANPAVVNKAFSAPPMSAPAMGATPSQNRSSNQSGSQSYSAPQSQQRQSTPQMQSKPAPKPAPTPAKSAPMSVQPKSSQMKSVAPQPAPTPVRQSTPAPQSKPSVVTSIFNAISNLFKRK